MAQAMEHNNEDYDREARLRFVGAANIRLNNAITEIRKLGKLYSPRYAYTPDDIQAMRKALVDAVDEQMEVLEQRKRPAPRVQIIKP